MRHGGVRAVRPRILALAALLGLVSGCSTTILGDVRKEPYGGAPLRNVAVFVLGTDPAVRRYAEEEFVRRLPMNTWGIAGDSLVPVAEQGDLEKVRSRLRASRFDGAIVARLTGIDGAPSAKPAPAQGGSLGDYYASTYKELERPDGSRSFTTVRIQTNVYAVATESLIWSGSSRTFNPDAVRDVAGDVAKAVVEQLQKARILSED